MEQVVVTGAAGRAQRREVGNTVSAISVGELEDSPTSVEDILSGSLPGVTLSIGEGMSGSGSQIRLRGNTSISQTNAPLIFVDGLRIRSGGYPKNVPPVGYSGRSANVTANPINDLNPVNIDRVEIVKGAAATTLYGTEAAEIVVSLPSRKAALIRDLWAMSGQPSDAQLSATVTSSYGDRTYSWDGRVHRVEGAIDEQTRTIDVVVRVSDPYNQVPTVSSRQPEQPPEQTRPPLAIGTYTTVDIEGRRDGTYHVVPRRAVHTRASDQPPVVWTVAGDSMLVERTVEPIQTVEEQTYLAPTLDPDTRVITTDLRVQTDSMAVRVAR
ncbi:MAG: hypothetical protein BRD27_03405 [Bacteroidetes bacterium QH_10_64_19]|nr:MAG: hypothetical protein BRD27_03405 [Bacteroidetes bacterium QH_10_64_19]